MIYGSVCSGIEAASMAWLPLGWTPAFLSEIEPFPRAVLARHHPSAPLHGDFTTIQAGQYDAINLLVGGTPCQSFSVAGLRGGMADERGNLALEYLRLAHRLRPRWLVWENVPGVLSSNGGRDFGSLLGGLVKLGYGFAYRVLDAQYFGLAQRRKRVFLVGYFGDWRRAAAVLFEPESMCGHPAPSREAGQNITETFSARATAGGGLGTDFECSGGVVSHCLTAGNKSGGHRYDYESETFIATAQAYRTSPNCGAWNTGDRTDALTTVTDPTSHVIVQPYTLAIRGRDGGHDLEYRQDGTANALLMPGGGRGDCGVGAVAHRSTVRRLTPRECERLQGFPDNYTAITFRGKPAADGNRYKALGNSMAVPCMAWIGKRIAAVDASL